MSKHKSICTHILFHFSKKDNNKLTGSVPVSIVSNRTYVNFDVSGNQLSDLIPVDGQTICSNINSATGVEDEHYCNCATECLVIGWEYPTTNKFGKKCQCEEALDCCDIYFVENNITNCVFCEAEGGTSNPDFLVPEWGYAPCSVASDYIILCLEIMGQKNNVMKLELNYTKEVVSVQTIISHQAYQKMQMNESKCCTPVVSVSFTIEIP